MRTSGKDKFAYDLSTLSGLSLDDSVDLAEDLFTIYKGLSEFINSHSDRVEILSDGEWGNIKHEHPVDEDYDIDFKQDLQKLKIKGKSLTKKFIVRYVFLKCIEKGITKRKDIVNEMKLFFSEGYVNLSDISDYMYSGYYNTVKLEYESGLIKLG